MRRALAAVALVLVLSACAVPIATPSPAPPNRYSWLMVHDWQRWGVQIGPKADPDGVHVAIYAWRDCAPAYSPCAWWYFHEYGDLDPDPGEELDPNAPPLEYAITRGVDGWHLLAGEHGKPLELLEVLDPGSTHPHLELGTELTAQ